MTRILLALLIASTSLFAGDQCSQMCVNSYRSCVSSCNVYQDQLNRDICRNGCEQSLDMCLSNCQ